MSRFEKRISDEQIVGAREKIAGGATLRSAAAEVPCAPSTLSYRIRRAEEAENAAPAVSEDSRSPQPVRILGGLDVIGGQVGPLQVLREALQATKTDGQPDWSTRISAARTLGTLRPQELEPKPDRKWVEPEIVVYDLPPGSKPVIHRATVGKTEASAGEAGATRVGVEAETIAEQPEPSDPCVFYYEPTGEFAGDSVTIGSWSPPVDDSQTGVKVRFVSTADRETADRWQAELAAGRRPQTGDEP